MIRKDIALDRAKNIIQWEMVNMKKNCDGGETPAQQHWMQNGMKIIWVDLNNYQHVQDGLVQGAVPNYKHPIIKFFPSGKSILLHNAVDLNSLKDEYNE